MTDFKFTIDEINTIAFKLSVMGNLPAKAVPQVRFVISEGKNGSSMAWMFPAVPSDDGFVKSEIYAPVGMFDDKKTYNGKLEVIIGHRYFVPTMGEVAFVSPLQVEVESITKNESDQTDEDIDVEAIVQSVISEDEARPAKRRPEQIAPQQKHIITASPAVITSKPAAIKMPLKEEQPRPNITRPATAKPPASRSQQPIPQRAPAKAPITQKPVIKPEQAAFKFKLKDMLAEGLKELWEDDADESRHEE